MNKLIRLITVASLIVLTSILSAVNVQGASASNSPAYHKLYNHRDSADVIYGYSGPNCTGTRWQIDPGQYITRGFSYDSHRVTKFKDNIFRTYHQVNSNHCVTSFNNATYMSVHVFNATFI